MLRLGARVRPLSLLDDLLQLPARGLTNVAFPLELARRELAAVSHREQRVLLLSDAVHNAGPDPRTFAAVLPRVDVLLDVTGEHDLALGQDIAAAGHGQSVPDRQPSRRRAGSCPRVLDLTRRRVSADQVSARRAHAALNAFHPALTCSASPVM